MSANPEEGELRQKPNPKDLLALATLGVRSARSSKEEKDVAAGKK